jgi:hypothetical protein
MQLAAVGKGTAQQVEHWEGLEVKPLDEGRRLRVDRTGAEASLRVVQANVLHFDGDGKDSGELHVAARRREVSLDGEACRKVC